MIAAVVIGKLSAGLLGVVEAFEDGLAEGGSAFFPAAGFGRSTQGAGHSGLGHMAGCHLAFLLSTSR